MTHTAVRLAPLALGLLLTSFPADVKADVVFGNLGANGTTGALQSTNTGITATTKRAQVFTTGTGPNLQLSSITLGAFSATSATVGLEVFNSAGNAPGSLFAASTNTQALSDNTDGALVTWSFANVAMAVNTSYWIVPSTGLNWSFRSSFTAFPTAQNSSGYGYAGASESFNGGTNWFSFEGGSAAYAVSVQAVPEPTTYALGAIGIAAAGLARWRRRTIPSGR